MRAGIVLPTSRFDDSGDFDLGTIGHLSSTLLARPADLVTAVPEATTIRLSASPSFRRDVFVATTSARSARSSTSPTPRPT